MRNDSSLTEEQRGTVMALFDAGQSRKAVANRLGISRDAVRVLHDRWRVRGGGALVTKPTRRSFSFAFKREIVQRCLAGETKVALAQEFDLSSPKLVAAWLRTYRREGEDGLRPKQHSRPRTETDAPRRHPGELERLRHENARLRAENAYLGKLRALSAPKRR